MSSSDKVEEDAIYTGSGTNAKGNHYVSFRDSQGWGYAYQNQDGSMYSRDTDGFTAYYGPDGSVKYGDDSRSSTGEGQGSQPSEDQNTQEEVQGSQPSEDQSTQEEVQGSQPSGGQTARDQGN